MASDQPLSTAVRPRLRGDLESAVLRQGVVLAADDRLVILRGAWICSVWPRLVGLLDGTHTLGDLEVGLPDIPHGRLGQLLQRLAHESLLELEFCQESGLTPAEYHRYRAHPTFLHPWNQNGGQALRRIQESRVAVIGLGGTGMAVVQGLVGAGIGALRLADDQAVSWEDMGTGYQPAQCGERRLTACAERAHSLNCEVNIEQWPGRLDSDLKELVTGCSLIIMVGNELPPKVFRALNAACLATYTPWLVSRPTARFAVIGPAFDPPHTACYECLQKRIYSNRGNWHLYEEIDRASDQHGRRVVAAECAPWSGGVGALTALLAVQLLLSSDRTLHPLYGRRFVLDLSSWQGVLEDVLMLPWCSACSTNQV
jgi:molybdopterin-synthase adenylyltransferase